LTGTPDAAFTETAAGVPRRGAPGDQRDLHDDPADDDCTDLRRCRKEGFGSPGADSFEQRLVERAQVEDALGRLPRKERTASVLRWGLDGGGTRTYEQVGALMGCQKSWARRLERQAARKLGEDPTLSGPETRY
jgi:DNA-directed RNA polymerase sigma subunit (sigma70/sigma32)